MRRLARALALAEGEGGGDPDVLAATATQRPEKIGMRLLTGTERLAIGGDELDGDEGRQPTLRPKRSMAPISSVSSSSRSISSACSAPSTQPRT